MDEEIDFESGDSLYGLRDSEIGFNRKIKDTNDVNKEQLPETDFGYNVRTQNA